MATKRKKITAKQRRLRKLVYKMLFLLAVFFALSAGFVYLFHLPYTRIQTIDVEGTELIDKAVLKEDVSLYLHEPALLFPNDNFFFYSPRKLEEYLLGRYPRIKTIEIDTDNFQDLYLVISERKTAFFAQTQGAYYEVDKTGKLIDSATEIDDNKKVFYINSDYYDVTQGEMMMNQEDFAALTEFLISLDTLGVVTKAIKLNNSIEYILELESGERLVINPRDEYTTLKEVIRQILPYEEFGFDFTSGVFAQPIEYINMRYGNKILYCYRGDACDDNYKL